MQNKFVFVCKLLPTSVKLSEEKVYFICSDCLYCSNNVTLHCDVVTIIIIVPHCLSNFNQETNNTNANETGVQCSLTSVSCYTIRPSQAFQPYKTHLAPHVSLARGWGGVGEVDGDIRQRVERWVWRYLCDEVSLVQQSAVPVYKVHCSLSGSLWVSMSLQIITVSLAKSEPTAVCLELSSYSYLPLLCQYRKI